MRRFLKIGSKTAQEMTAWVAWKTRVMRGASRHYDIFPGYKHRQEARYFDDTELTDEWQREVYEFAAENYAHQRFALHLERCRLRVRLQARSLSRQLRHYWL